MSGGCYCKPYADLKIGCDAFCKSVIPVCAFASDSKFKEPEFRFPFLLQGSLIFCVFVLFLLQVAFEDPEVQGIYLLTDGKPVSLHFMSCPQLKSFAKKSNWEINC